ncbi:MAG: hypothetical protein V4621_07195 [Pseudomonadota bacterium]
MNCRPDFANNANGAQHPQLRVAIPSSATFLKDIADMPLVQRGLLANALLCVNNNGRHLWCKGQCVQLSERKAGYDNVHAIELPGASRLVVIETITDGNKHYMPLRFFNAHEAYDAYLDRMHDNRPRGQNLFHPTCNTASFEVAIDTTYAVKPQSPLAWLMQKMGNLVAPSQAEPALAIA